MVERPLSLQERIEHRMARVLLGRSEHIHRLTRASPIVRDGLTLHPEIQLLLAVRKAMGAKGFSEMPPEIGRRVLRREALVHKGPEIRVAGTRDIWVDGADGPLQARLYVPPHAGASTPLLVFFHGGGFVLGDLETHDSCCRLLCREAGVMVMAVLYRLAPENPFPAAVDDAVAATRWAFAHARELGADPSRIAVGGDSAGGNLSAVVAQALRDAGGPKLAGQLLMYPAVDFTSARPSVAMFAEGFFLTRADMRWFAERYIAGADAHDPRLAPLLAKDLSGLPPALVVTAGFDPLRDEGEDYANALRKAGTPAVLKRCDGFIHGFINMVGVSPACRAALTDIARSFRALMDERAPQLKRSAGGQS